MVVIFLKLDSYPFPVTPKTQNQRTNILKRKTASPTIIGGVPESVAIGTVIGSTAATVALSLMKLVSIPVIKLVEIHSPVPLFKNSGRMDTKLFASHSAAPVEAKP